MLRAILGINLQKKGVYIYIYNKLGEKPLAEDKKIYTQPRFSCFLFWFFPFGPVDLKKQWYFINTVWPQLQIVNSSQNVQRDVEAHVKTLISTSSNPDPHSNHNQWLVRTSIVEAATSDWLGWGWAHVTSEWILDGWTNITNLVHRKAGPTTSTTLVLYSSIHCACGWGLTWHRVITFLLAWCILWHPILWLWPYVMSETINGWLSVSFLGYLGWWKTGLLDFFLGWFLATPIFFKARWEKMKILLLKRELIQF